LFDAIALAVATAAWRSDSPYGAAGQRPELGSGRRTYGRGRTDKFTAKVAALRKSDPVIDWSDCEEMDGDCRRAAKWLSEVSDV